VSAKLSEEDARNLKFDQLGTRSDPQYRVAETTLSRQISAAGSRPTVTYDPEQRVPALSGSR
jgi:carboxyl-terminal processing protease